MLFSPNLTVFTGYTLVCRSKLYVLHHFHSLSESGNIMKNVCFVISCLILLFSPRFPLPVFVCFTALLLITPVSHQLIPPGVLKRVFSPHFLQSVHLFARPSLPGLLLLTFVFLNFLGLDLRFQLSVHKAHISFRLLPVCLVFASSFALLWHWIRNRKWFSGTVFES